MEKKENVLEPCPFCGEVPTIEQRSHNIKAIVCPKESSCKGTGLVILITHPTAHNRAIACWNKRVGR